TVKTTLLLLLAYSGSAAETGGDYYSDQEYQKLRSYTAPSSFYPDGNSGQLQLLIMCIDRGKSPSVSEPMMFEMKTANEITALNAGGRRLFAIRTSSDYGRYPNDRAA